VKQRGILIQDGDKAYSPSSIAPISRWYLWMSALATASPRMLWDGTLGTVGFVVGSFMTWSPMISSTHYHPQRWGFPAPERIPDRPTACRPIYPVAHPSLLTTLDTERHLMPHWTMNFSPGTSPRGSQSPIAWKAMPSWLKLLDLH
jgi:hypothetical protein